jgi:hypothetical protein
VQTRRVIASGQKQLRGAAVADRVGMQLVHRSRIAESITRRGAGVHG